MSSYRFEKISRDHLDDLAFLFKDAFGREIDRDYVNKKQDTSAFGPSFVGYIAYSETNEPAAFYGVFPCLVIFNDQKYLVAQSGDTMTHSNHRGKGLFTQLALKTYEYCREAGVHLVFGFPNENSYPGFVKNLGWEHFDDFQIYLIRVKTISWTRIKNTFKLGSNIHLTWCRFVMKFIKKGTYFQNSVLLPEVGGVDHSPEFFEYKTYEEKFLVSVAGVNAWIKIRDEFLLIGDIEQCDEKQFSDAISGLKSIAFWLGLPHLRHQCSRGVYHEAGFIKHGVLFNKTYPIGGVNFTNALPINQLKFTLSDNDGF
jgi:GNAT superfamily N-acetyltransferase